MEAAAGPKPCEPTTSSVVRLGSGDGEPAPVGSELEGDAAGGEAAGSAAGDRDSVQADSANAAIAPMSQPRIWPTYVPVVEEAGHGRLETPLVDT